MNATTVAPITTSVTATASTSSITKNIGLKHECQHGYTDAFPQEKFIHSGVLYWDKQKVLLLYRRAGVQFLGCSAQSGHIHTIDDLPSNVKHVTSAIYVARLIDVSLLRKA